MDKKTFTQDVSKHVQLYGTDELLDELISVVECLGSHLIELRTQMNRSQMVCMLRRVLRCEWGLSRRVARPIYVGPFLACDTLGSPLLCDFAMTM